MKKKIKITGMILFLTLLVIGGIVLLTDVYRVFLPLLETGVEIDKNYGDTILVLGGGLKKGSQIGFSTEERLILAIELYHQKKRTIIISDGSLYYKSPAVRKITDFLLENGVSSNFIRLEGKSQTTFDNFNYTRAILDDLKTKEIIVCTSPYHQKRAEMMLKYLKIHNFKMARMKYSEIHQAHTMQQRGRNLWLILREYMGILKFKLIKK
ncbi:MAG: YdcF family protein [Candidatus Omnitrophota bacterium]